MGKQIYRGYFLEQSDDAWIVLDSNGAVVSRGHKTDDDAMSWVDQKKKEERK